MRRERVCSSPVPRCAGWMMTYAFEVGSFCSSIAKLSNRAFSSFRVMSGNSSNLRQVCVTGKCTGQLAEQSKLYPPIDRVAVRACPASPVVSTLIKLVPCPSMIRPADTVQLYTGEILLNGPLSTALKVTGRSNPTLSGQLIETVGQTGIAGHY